MFNVNDIRLAYIAGATDVHNNWQADRDPDFKEAASDYVANLDLEAARPLADGLDALRDKLLATKTQHKIDMLFGGAVGIDGEETREVPINPDGEAAWAVISSLLQHKEEAERERDELRKRLNELARFYPPTSETFSYRSDGYASGWRDGVQAMQKKVQQP